VSWGESGAVHIDIITIFPGMFRAVLGESIIKRAQAKGLLRIRLHDLRRYTHDRHRSIDDRPYGGGPGMVMKPEPIFGAIEAIRAPKRARRSTPLDAGRVILMSPDGEPLSTALAKELASEPRLVIIAGHYEGVDDRVNTVVDRSVSIGDYIVTGGELPAMVLIDCVARFLPGVIGHEQATVEESFADGLLEYPQYTRPPVFRGMAVPDVLLSGNHAQISRWRKRQALARTRALRPDLITKHGKFRATKRVL